MSKANPRTNVINRRDFIGTVAAAAAIPAIGTHAIAQMAGDRPTRTVSKVNVLNPRGRVPVSLIIDDSTCLVNLNRFAMPQFDEAHEHKDPSFHKPWRDWPVQIPDAFVRKFGEWCSSHGVKGKYSIVPFPACVGRLDRELPGWSRADLQASLELVRTLMMPNWDIHPEMVTHTRVIDLRSGHPYPDYNIRFMENWEWTTGRSVDELASYMEYALTILKNVGLPCEGITTPGGFGNRVLPELAQASYQSVRSVFSTPAPHYFRHLYDTGTSSVAPRVEYARDLDSTDPKCVVSIIGCTGDWTGGWDCTTPEGADRFITPDLSSGRMVEVIQRGEPACMVCHWTGIYWNGEELGFKVFKEVVKRLEARFDNLVWMKLSEIANYWAAKELTSIKREGSDVLLAAPFACKAFTLQVNAMVSKPLLRNASGEALLREVASEKLLEAGTWCRAGGDAILCFDLGQGSSRLTLG